MSKYVTILKQENLLGKDRALRIKNNMLGFFSYSTSDYLSRSGILVRGKETRDILLEDAETVLGSSSYRLGEITLEGIYKKKQKRGGYDLAYEEITEFPPEHPASLNTAQMIEFLKRLKENPRFCIDYIKSNRIDSYFFANKIRLFVHEIDAPSSVAIEIDRICEQIHNADLKKLVISEEDSKERNSLLRKAGF